MIYRSLVHACKLSAFGCLAALSACHGSNGTSEKQAASSLTVRTVSPQQADWPSTVSASGAIKPWQEAVVSAETGPYRIATVERDVGASVQRGDVLARLASQSVEANVARLKAQVAEARANLGQAASDVRRAALIGAGGALSSQQIEKYEVARLTAQATLASAKAQLEAAKIELSQTSIVAPDAGIIASRTALLGKVVNAGDELFRIIRKGRLEWQAELDARQLLQLRPGAPAHISLAGGGTVDGRVRLLAPTVDGDTSRGLVFVALPPNASVRSGVFASGTLMTGLVRVMTVPDSALVLRDGRAFVFSVEKHGRVRQREVIPGARRDGRVAVTGISGRVLVVESGAAFLSDGVHVRTTAIGNAGR